MTGLNRWGATITGFALAFSVLAGSATALPRLYVPLPPPRAIVERVARAPGIRHVWIRGYYRWDGGAYRWVPGHWVLPPRAGQHWVTGYWAHDRHGWYWVAGHWR